ncbi:MAG: oxygen-independent coproporphyrinogen III oxidase [Myxococcales bacterium]|nr:oxygen-independent coproporphyrinogen III oxidase [Myxococcales bacterium]MCB9647570.1 oxygen-independent coproporphyrinogen III oxidase [Deltaproteobacteria bacterium]
MGLFPEISEALIQRLDVAGPRYTSYPTVPEWSGNFTAADTHAALKAAGAMGASEPLGLYVHLPFCEERCTFCGCNVVVTKETERADQYLDYVTKELDLVVPDLGDRRRVSQIHWGGGTPTFLREDQIQRLWGEITKRFEVLPGAEVSIEIDPAVTTLSQLDLLRKLGFNRVSMGVQDFDPDVQEVIHRIQSVEETKALVDHARDLGFSGVNFDLIYGLPLQTPERWQETLRRVMELGPDRLAVYSFAYLPDLRPHQKRLPMADIPVGVPKLALFKMAYDTFATSGYEVIGMDHFARPEDELSKALGKRKLHRNFQGYTVKAAADTVAVGVTAIGDMVGRYTQNVPQLMKYYRFLDEGQLPTVRGIVLTDDDVRRREVINNLMCNAWVDLGPDAQTYFAQELATLKTEAYADLCEVRGREVELTANGKIFIRNVAMVFDARLRAHEGEQRFSRTV